MSAEMMMIKIRLRPGNRRIASAYALRTPSVIFTVHRMTVMMSEFRR